MLIVCTTDPIIVATAQQSPSAAAWGTLVVLDGRLTQRAATVAIEAVLRALGHAEALCFSAHGNNEEIGDADDHWGWTYVEVARMLAQRAPQYSGDILIHACASQIVNFSANLAVALEGRHALAGTWVFGYNRSLPRDANFPRPDQLRTQVDLQGTRVD